MKRTTAHQGGGHGHAEFELDIGDCAPELADSLINYLEKQVNSGIEFIAGDIIQFGCAILHVADLPDGRLTLLEPARGSVPPQFTRSVAESVLATVRQIHSADSVGLADRIDFPHPFRLGYICSAVEPPDAVVFSRDEKLQDDEGWSILCADPDHDHDDAANMGCRTLHEIAAEIPEFWLFAAFPVGSTILLAAGYPPRIWLDGKQREIQQGSFLDELFDVWM